MSTKERQPYHPPEITRVVLRQEQAILSQCSTMGSDPRDMAIPGTCAYGPDNCKMWGSSGSHADSGDRPS